MLAEDWDAAPDDTARRRVVVDQVAVFTDQQAVARHAALVGVGPLVAGDRRTRA